MNTFWPETQNIRRKAVKFAGSEEALMIYLMVYLAAAFHFYMQLNPFSIGIVVLASLSAGLFVAAILFVLPGRMGRYVELILIILISLVYLGECLFKVTLQQFYPILSGLDTAAGNRLTDYKDAAIQACVENLPGIVILFVFPVGIAVVWLFLRRNRMDYSFKRKKKVAVVCLASAVFFHLVMIGIIQLYPWEGDFTPKSLYKTDLYTDEQVEQLGLLNMLRLDVIHTVFGAPDSGVPQVRENAEEVSNEPEETVYDDNVLDIDFASMQASAATEDAAWLSQYFESVTPTSQNEYTGMFEGYNVIFLTAEGFSGYVIDPELTPTLYKLSHEGFVFSNFYSTLHFTSTSGGEFQNLTGLYPKAGFPVSMTETGKRGTYLPFTLANRLNAKGYTSIGYHFNSNMYGRELSHPNLGYEWRQATECSRPIERELAESGKPYWPQSDDYMIEQTFADYVDKQPFNIYYLTISAHLPYGYDSNMMSARNRELVEGLPYSEKTKAYIAANMELEKGLTWLVNKLEETGIADKTLIVMAPDHIPYSDPDILEELAGRSFGGSGLANLDEQDVDLDIYRNTWILWSASMKEPVEVDKVCSQVDILPTVLNLRGEEYDSRMLAGVDVLSEADPLVVFTSNSWKTDRGTYNRFTGTFTPAEGVEMSEEERNVYVENMKYLMQCRLKLGQLIIENDYYRTLMGTGNF